MNLFPIRNSLLIPHFALLIILSFFLLSETPIAKKSQIELVIQNGHTSGVNGILLTKDESKMISYSNDKTIKIWDMKEGKLHKILEGHTGFSLLSQGIRLTRDEKKLIYFHSLDKIIKIWDMENGKLLNTLEGHTDGVIGIQLTKDDRKLISYSDDKKIKIWDLENGKLIKTLEGHTDIVNGIQLTKVEKQLISYSFDKTIKIWNMENGKLLKTLEGHTKRIDGIQLTKDENQIISCSLDKTIKIWDLKNGKLIKTLDGHTEIVNEIQLTKDEKKLISYSFDKTIKIWNMENGKLLKTLEGHTERVDGIQLTKDNKKLISYSNDKTIKIWDMESGKLLKTLKGHTEGVNGIRLTKDNTKLISYSWENSIKIWDLENGELLKTLEGHTGMVFGIQLTKDEKQLISYSSDGAIKIWSIEEPKLLRTIEGHTALVHGAIHTIKNESKLIFYYYDKTLMVWNLENGKLFKSLDGHSSSIREIQLTRNGKQLISCSDDTTIKVWNLENWKLLMTLKGHTSSVWGIILTSDEKKLVSYSSDNTIKIWNFENGELLTTLDGHSKAVRGIKFTKDDKKSISYSNDNTIKIWNMENGKLLKTLEGHTDTITGIQLMKDEKQLISHSMDNTIKIWDIENGKLLKTLDGHSMVIGIQLTKDEKQLISYSFDKTIKIWDIENGKLLRTLDGYTDWINGIHLTKDEKKLYSYSGSKIVIWDIASGKCLQILNQHSSSIQQIIFQETNPTLLLSISSDGSLRYWDMDTGKLLLTQLLFKEGESIYYTPDGYFDFTDKKVMDYITFVTPSMQNGFLDIQDMYKFRVQGLLEKTLQGKTGALKKSSNFTKGVDTVPLIKALFEKQEKISADKDTKTLRFEIKENGSKLKYVIAYIDGVQRVKMNLEEKDIVGDEKENANKYQIKIDVPLDYGVNRLEIKAYNEFDVPQSYPTIELERAAPKDATLIKPDLYLLSVGINKYKENGLSFSVSDATAIADVIEKNSGGLYNKIFKTVLTEDKATQKGIKDALAEITNKSRPQDVVLIYMSGHGMNAKDEDNKSLFYFVPQDFSWPDDPRNANIARTEGIDAEYLDQEFMKIKAHKLVLILDACHSGSVNVALASKGDDKDKATRLAMEEMANGTGRFIFASSSGNQESRESDKVEHGLYTYVLLNAFGKNANTEKKIENADILKKDGYIYMSELEAYIKSRFKDQTKDYLKGKIQTPPTNSLGRKAIDENINDFPLLMVGTRGVRP